MHKLLPVLVLVATALTPRHGSAAADLRLSADASVAENPVVLVGGMGGGTSGGMAGAGGGMGGMTGGGMGGMTGGMGGVFGGMNPYGGAQGGSFGPAFGRPDPTGEASQPAQYYWCVTPYDQCSLSSSPGSLHSGASCTCSTGHPGRIK